MPGNSQIRSIFTLSIGVKKQVVIKVSNEQSSTSLSSTIKNSLTTTINNGIKYKPFIMHSHYHNNCLANESTSHLIRKNFEQAI